MNPQKRTMAWIVLLGGAAVLTSYAFSLRIDPATRADLWGGVPSTLVPTYVASMVFAAAGYFAFTFFLLFRADPDRVWSLPSRPLPRERWLAAWDGRLARRYLPSGAATGA